MIEPGTPLVYAADTVRKNPQLGGFLMTALEREDKGAGAPRLRLVLLKDAVYARRCFERGEILEEFESLVRPAPFSERAIEFVIALSGVRPGPGPV